MMKTAVRGLPRAALDHPNEESSPVVLVLDGEGLLALNYNLVPFSDPVWGEGECDWENEIECSDDIEPLEEVLIAVEPVAPERGAGTSLSAVVSLSSPICHRSPAWNWP